MINFQTSYSTQGRDAPSFADTIIGTGGDDVLRGGNLDDLILGKSGDDQLLGGAGADSLFGGSGDDTLYGGSGDDTLDGGSGHDSLFGGSGDDLIYAPGSRQYDHVTLDGGSGIDTLSFARFNKGTDFFLEDNPSNSLFGFENIIGSAFDDSLHGTAKSEVLDGDAGDDLIYGHNTPFDVGSGDTLIGGDGDDTLYGGKHADDLRGGDGEDLIIGNRGADTIDGGAGKDRLSISLEGSVVGGGADADMFNFFAPKGHGVSGGSLIADLENQDLIDLHRIDADSGAGGDQAFTLVSNLSGAAGEAALVYDAGSDQTSLLLDTDGDGTANITILLSGDHTDFTNFVL